LAAIARTSTGHDRIKVFSRGFPTNGVTPAPRGNADRSRRSRSWAGCTMNTGSRHSRMRQVAITVRERPAWRRPRRWPRSDSSRRTPAGSLGSRADRRLHPIRRGDWAYRRTRKLVGFNPPGLHFRRGVWLRLLLMLLATTFALRRTGYLTHPRESPQDFKQFRPRRPPVFVSVLVG
jgi:hypothetical protein